MTAIRQTLELAALVCRAFWRDPGTVIAMVGHHWFGNRERAAELAAQVKTTGARNTEPNDGDA